MSVQELVLTPKIGEKIKVSHNEKEFEFDLGYEERTHIWLDRNQAYMLFLYLQEHLNK